MAYYVKGKAYTDQPLMDEIVYNCKLILDGIVIKNDVLANNSETENSLTYAEQLYIKAEQGSIPFELFAFSKELLVAFGYSEIQAEFYLKNRDSIPEADRTALMIFANQYFDEHFEEENNYYRMLTGLPPYGSGEEYYIWLTSDDIPSGYTKEVDFSLPLHKQPNDLINILYTHGVITQLRSTYPGSNYSYMLYLGDRKLDLYTIRKAGKWDILYMPNVYYLVEDKFADFYKVNRETYMTRSYQEFFAQSGEYYDQMMILIVLAQTFADMVTDTPQWYIRRDIFDLRSCKYFLESSGVDYFKEIPLRYQIRIVKNLNKLIKYKSSNQNISDIIDIFNISNTSVNKYWLYKKDNGDSNYELEFIASKYTDSYDAYIKNSSYRTPYDDITLQDKYWDGEDTHDNIKNEILNQEFTIRGTKYMSVEYKVSLEKYSYEMSYMLGLILDSKLYDGLDDIQISVPSINETANFRLTNLFLFLCLLSLDYNQLSDDIRFVDDLSDGPKPAVNEDEDLYDWKVRTFPEIFVKQNGMVNGFNLSADIPKIIKEIRSGRHSHFRFGLSDEENGTTLTQAEYYEKADAWVKYFRLEDYLQPTTIDNIDDLIGVYTTNTEIHDIVKDTIINAPDNNEKAIADYIYRQLFTKKFDEAMYTQPDGTHYENIVELLEARDYILYETYVTIQNESDIESRKDMLRSIMNDIIDTLDYYLSDDNGFEYLYAFVAVSSPDAIIRYIYLMLDFFKSYKVYFLDPYYTIESNDKLENNVRPIDNVADWSWTKYQWDKAHTSDGIAAMGIQKFLTDEGETKAYEMADIYAYYDPDPLMDLDMDGVTAEKGETVTTEVDGGTADESTALPYITLNGGHSYLGIMDFSDINGGVADETYKDYYEVDGGEAYDPDVEKTDAMGSQMFNYELDGGAAGSRRFITNSMDMELVGTELSADVVLSPKADNIQILDDGLYVAYDSFGGQTQFDNLKYTFNEVIKRVKTEGATALATIKVITDIDALDARIRVIVNDTTYNMEYANAMNTNDTFVKMVNAFVDEIVELFNDKFKTDESVNPYAWTDL